MADDYNISYSYSLGNSTAKASQRPPASAAPASDDPELYAFDDCTEIDLPSNMVLLVSNTSPVQQMVTRDVAIALRHCESFRTIDGHAKYLTAYMPELGGNTAAVSAVLESMRDTGLLVAATAHAALFSAAGSTAAKPAPSRIFVITCDRPDAVARLLDSMLGVAELSRHESIFLIDDSRDSANAEANKKHVENFNVRSASVIQYFGTLEREQLLQSLIAELPGQENSLRFLLDQNKWSGQKTYGLSRTLCLLLSVNYRAVVLDDDVICSAIDSPHTAPGTQFYDGMCEADFYPSSEGWSRRFPPRTEDPLSGHLTCLGQNLGQALATLGDGSFDERSLADSQRAAMQHLSGDSSVLITQNGTFGDPGTLDSSWCFNLAGDSLTRLLDAPETFQNKLKIRQYWMGWSRPTFSRQANMSQITGLDNTALLPPYFPAWRGEDQVFAAMVRFLFPSSVVLNYPWAVPHQPLEPRSGQTQDGSPQINMELVENFLIENAPAGQDLSFAARLQTLVQMLRNASEKSDEELAAYVRTSLASVQADTAIHASDQLRQAPEAHLPWRTALEERRQRQFTALGQSNIAAQITDLTPDLAEADLWAVVREYCNAFASCIEDWPAIRAAAARTAQ